MKSPLAEMQRDALIEAMLPDVPFDGWSRAALRAAARRIGMPADEALALFPDGAARACRLLQPLGRSPHARPARDHGRSSRCAVPERIALAITTRLEILAPWREAVRRALSVLALPQHAPLGLRLLYETVDGDLVRRRRPRDRFQLLHQARHARGGLCRHIALLARRQLAGFCATPGPFSIVGSLRWRRSARHASGSRSALERLPNPLRLLRRFG